MSITSTIELRDAIRLLEDRRSAQMQMIKEEFSLVVDSFKPAALIKNSVSGITSSPRVWRNIVIAAVGLTIAYYTRKQIKKTKTDPIRKLVAMALQAGIGSLLAVKGQDLREMIYSFFKKLFNKKENGDYK